MIAFLIFSGVAAAFVSGMSIGYSLGVRETERRWSEAMTRATLRGETAFKLKPRES